MTWQQAKLHWVSVLLSLNWRQETIFLDVKSWNSFCRAVLNFHHQTGQARHVSVMVRGRDGLASFRPFFTHFSLSCSLYTLSLVLLIPFPVSPGESFIVILSGFLFLNAEQSFMLSVEVSIFLSFLPNTSEPGVVLISLAFKLLDIFSPQGCSEL